MLKLSKAAIIIAVFLLTATSGCYTKLKSTEVRIIPEAEDEQYIEADWDFGWGWSDPGWDYNDSYHIYYQVNWWDECRWCEKDEWDPDIGLFENTKKIPHRNDAYIPSGAAIQPSEMTPPPSVQVKPQAPVTDPGTSTPIIQTKTKSSESNKSGDNSKTKKKKKKRRR